MDLDQFALFRMISRRLDWTAQRQTVLAQNVANSDTPGYRPSDVQSFAEHVRGTGPSPVRLATTEPGHLAGGAVRATPARVERRPITEASPNGNQVEIEREMIDLHDTATQQQLALNLYRKQLGMIRIALGRAGRT